MASFQRPIYVHVYDIAPQVNAWTRHIGVGAYHSGVEVLGKEWCYGPGGVVAIKPRSYADGADYDGARYKETVDMGTLYGSANEVHAAIGSLRERFVGSAYHIVSHNCNHFAEALLLLLVREPLPKWVNRAAEMGALRWLMPKQNQDGTPTKKAAPGKAAKKQKELTPAQAAMLEKMRKQPSADEAAGGGTR